VPTIVVADDDLDIRRLIALVLKKLGHEVVEAEDGDQALKLVLQNNAAMLITDIVMPRKEGIELITELKQHAPELKVIAFSGGGKSDPDSYLAFAKGLGADAVFTKPVPIAQLQMKVVELLS
jgi:CheY-like chemotaxis protein